MPENVRVEVTPSEVPEENHQDDDRIARLEERLSAAETRETPQPDLSPIHDAIAALGSRLDQAIESITSARAPAVEASTEATEETEEAPKVITQMTTREEVEEKPPRPSHFIFRRFGQR